MRGDAERAGAPVRQAEGVRSMRNSWPCRLPGTAAADDRRSGTFRLPRRKDSEWSEMEVRSVRFAGHPQETTENSVDLGHLRYVHGYDSVNAVGPVSVEGAWLKSCFDFKRTQTVAGMKCFTWDVSAVTHVHGLGYSYVEVREHSIGMDTPFVGARNRPSTANWSK